MSFDWWVLAKWAARDEQLILPTSTNPWITTAAGTQRVNKYLAMGSCCDCSTSCSTVNSFSVAHNAAFIYVVKHTLNV